MDSVFTIMTDSLARALKLVCVNLTQISMILITKYFCIFFFLVLIGLEG